MSGRSPGIPSRGNDQDGALYGAHTGSPHPPAHAPHPLLLAAPEVVNPIPKLLLSFPAPQIISQTRLETVWSLGDDSPAATPFPSCTDALLESSHLELEKEEMNRLAEGMERSAKELFLSYNCTNFLQEEFHHESQQLQQHQQSISEAADDAPASIGCLTGRIASSLTTLLSSVAPQTVLLESSHGKRGGIINAAPTSHRVPLTRVPRVESWSKVESTGITIASQRPHLRVPAVGMTSAESVSPVSGPVMPDFNPNGLSSVDGKDVSRSSKVGFQRCGAGGGGHWSVSESTSLSALAAACQSEAKNASASSFCEAVKCGDVSNMSPAILFHFITILPIQPQPFIGVENEQMIEFLVSLVKVEDTMVSGPIKQVERDGEAVPTQETVIFLRGLLCAQCLAHPRFDPHLTPDGTMDALITIFGKVLRRTSDVLQQISMEEVERVVNGEEPALVVGGKRGGATQSTRSSGPHDGTSKTTSSVVTALLPLLEQMRCFLRCFAVILSNTRVCLATQSDIHRLEELGHQCIFSLPRQCTIKAVYHLYSTYIIYGSLHMCQCLWSHLDETRQSTADSFFQRLSLSEWLSHRSYELALEGRAVMPLTIAMTSAAQSLPLALTQAVEVGGGGTALLVDALQRQCNCWSSAFLKELLIDGAAHREKAEESIVWTVAVQLVEDLTDMVGIPEWPVADLLLRSILLAMAQLCLGTEVDHSSVADTLRPLAVDMVAHVACKLFDTNVFPISTQILDEAERLGDSLGSQSAALESAFTSFLRSTGVPAPAKETWEAYCSDLSAGYVKKEEEVEEFYGRPLLISLYEADTKCVGCSEAADATFVWLQIRAARLLVWMSLQDSKTDWVPGSFLGNLIRRQAPALPATERPDWGGVYTMSHAVATQSSKSMLGARMRQTLVSFLLSGFHLKGPKTAEVSVTDVAQKKALSHLARLTALYQPLHRLLWPIARQCVRDDSARVRESIVPLLLTLLHNSMSGGATAATTTTSSPVKLTTDIISSLLYLLGDKSTSVVSRVIAAIDTFLSEESHARFFSSLHGTSLLTFIQTKLLGHVGPTSEQKHRQEVVRHFLHRWVLTLANTEGSLTGAHGQLAAELIALTVMGSPEYPHDITEDHPLVYMLRAMGSHVASLDTPGIGGTGTVSLHGNVAPARRRSRVSSVEGSQLQHIMRCAARSLWARYQCLNSPEDAVSCLATLHVLALGSGEWVGHLSEAFVQLLTYPPSSSSAPSPLVLSSDTLGAVLLHTCQILCAVLNAPRTPLFSLDHLARCLTTLLSKYVGPLQQRIIVASCNALGSLITCGTKQKLPRHVNPTYLRLCYSLMNTYYVRVKSLLPTLASQPRSVAYTQRFLFLLAEFLRVYPGWKQQPPHPILLEEFSHDDMDGAAPSSSAVPNLLAKGSGVLENTYQLVEEVLKSISLATREKVAVIALRGIASLCMQDPTTYFYRCEEHIRDALTSSDVSYQIQGLTLLVDFLNEEDATVEAASQKMERLNTTALIVGDAHQSSASEEEAEEKGGGKGVLSTRQHRSSKRRGASGKASSCKGKTNSSHSATPASGRLRKAPRIATGDATEDLNSGMATWVLQRFHTHVVHLGSTAPHVQVRLLCLQLLQISAEGGLLPPDRYVQVIIALAADLSPSLRRKAKAILTSHCDRHGEVVASSASRGILLAYDLHHACRADLLRSAVLTSGEAADGDLSGTSAHGCLYKLMHKRLRENLITSLLRFFHQKNKALTWFHEHFTACTLQTAPAEGGASDPSSSIHPVTFLCHLAIAIYTLPFSSEIEVVHVLQQCREGIDLNGQVTLEALRQRGKVVVGHTTDAGEEDWDSDALLLWRTIGVILLIYLRQLLWREYRFTPAKMLKYQLRQGKAAPVLALHQRDPHGEVTANFLQCVQDLVQHTVGATISGDPIQKYWPWLSTELERLLQEEGVDEPSVTYSESSTQKTAKSGQGSQRSRVTRSQRSCSDEKVMGSIAHPRQKRQRASEELEDDEDFADDSTDDDLNSSILSTELFSSALESDGDATSLVESEEGEDSMSCRSTTSLSKGRTDKK